MALETEVEVLKSVVQKLDSSIEKISEVSNNIGRLLAVHDERLNSLEKVSDKRQEEIKELHSRITTQTREIMDKLDTMETRLEKRMDDSAASAQNQHEDIKKEIQKDIKGLEDRITSLEKWKWYAIGASASFGFFLSTMLDKFM